MTAHTLYVASALREVAARALHSLTPRLPDYIQEKGIQTHYHACLSLYTLCVVLPHLLPLVVTSDPRLRHGALHAVAEVALSLHTLRCSPSHPLSAVLGEELVRQLVDIVPQVLHAVVPYVVVPGVYDSWSLMVCSEEQLASV